MKQNKTEILTNESLVRMDKFELLEYQQELNKLEKTKLSSREQKRIKEIQSYVMRLIEI